METHPNQVNTELTDDQRQRLARVYQFLLSLRDKNKTAGREEFGDLTQPAVTEVLPTKERHSDSIQ